MPDAVWDEVREPWEMRTVQRGEVLTTVGEVERRFGMVVDGVQRVFFATPDGSESTVAFAYPPDFTGVPDSFFRQTPSPFTLQALTDGRMLQVDHDRFAALMDRHRVLDRWAWRMLAAAISGRARRERELLSSTAEERYRRLLRESPQLLQLVPLKHVASYLGMSPETLSRVRAAV
jgi:CRP-like cAMP-binding protein